MKILLINPAYTRLKGTAEIVIFDKNCDFVALRKAEDTISELVARFENNSSNFEDIKGLFFKKDGIIINISFSPFIENIDRIPPARHSLFNNHNLNKTLLSSMVNMLINSRSYPFQCRFCSVMN